MSHFLNKVIHNISYIFHFISEGYKLFLGRIFYVAKSGCELVILQTQPLKC